MLGLRQQLVLVEDLRCRQTGSELHELGGIGNDPQGKQPGPGGGVPKAGLSSSGWHANTIVCHGYGAEGHIHPNRE